MKRTAMLLAVGFALIVGAVYYFTTYNPFVSDSQAYADKTTREMQAESIHHQKVMGCLNDADCYAAMKKKEQEHKQSLQ